MRNLKTFWRTEDGATAVEYALLGTLIAIAIVTVVAGIGVELSASFSEMSSALP